MPAKHLIIKGKVQGVFYRATAKDVAESLGITGWIRNTKEGSVEVIISGNEDKLQEFIKWAKKGPDRAFVKEVILNDAEDITFSEFVIQRH